MNKQVKEKQQIKEDLEKINLNDFISFDNEFIKKFGDDVDVWSDKNYKYYSLVRNAVIKNTGLSFNELTMFLNIRKFDLLTDVNMYTFRLVDYIKNQQEKGFANATLSK